MFDECKTNQSEDKMGIFSITQNILTQRKQQNSKENRLNEERRISQVDMESDSISTSTTANSMNRVDNFKHAIRKEYDVISDSSSTNDERTQSVFDYVKTLFRCNKTMKVNEELQTDYQMNLHLRMNDIFSMHDKLSDIAEDLNDLYSTGKFTLNKKLIYWHSIVFVYLEMVVYITGAFVLILMAIFYETKVNDCY